MVVLTVAKTMFIGTEDDIGTIDRKTWRSPFVAGMALIMMYTCYELYKLSFVLAADMTLYYDYSTTGHDLSYIINMVLVTIGLLATSVVLIAANRSIKDKTGKARYILAISITITGFLCISFILAIVRVVTGIAVITASADPASAWIYRFYRGAILLVEWLAIPDIIFNFMACGGMVLVAFTAFEYTTNVTSYIDIMERGLKSTPETVTVDGRKYRAECKMFNGIKACSIDG